MYKVIIEKQRIDDCGNLEDDYDILSETRYKFIEQAKQATDIARANKLCASIMIMDGDEILDCLEY